MNKPDFDRLLARLGGARPQQPDWYRALALDPGPFIGIAEAAHHVMADRPFALTAAIQALVATWLGAAWDRR